MSAFSHNSLPSFSSFSSFSCFSHLQIGDILLDNRWYIPRAALRSHSRSSFIITGYDTSQGIAVCIKAFDKSRLDPHGLEVAQTEGQTLSLVSSLDHPHLPRLFAIQEDDEY